MVVLACSDCQLCINIYAVQRLSCLASSGGLLKFFAEQAAWQRVYAGAGAQIKLPGSTCKGHAGGLHEFCLVSSH